LGVVPDVPSTVLTAIEQACEEAGVTLVELIVRGQQRQVVLEVLIDTVDGITHDHCRAVSRGVDARLESEEFYGRLRAVDVSSPGADAPVKFLWQLTKHVGRTVRVVRKDETVIEGALQRADDTGLDVQPKGTAKNPVPLTTIPVDDVKEARVVISFR
jgi:ribosome maturation factor RimP